MENNPRKTSWMSVDRRMKEEIKILMAQEEPSNDTRPPVGLCKSFKYCFLQEDGGLAVGSNGEKRVIREFQSG